MKVGLGIPYWGSDPVRLSNYAFIKDFVLGQYDFDQLSLLPPGGWNRGSARNHLVSLSGDMDVVVLVDADTMPETSTLRIAIEAAYTLGGLHFAFNRFRGLNDYGTRLLKLDVPGWGTFLDMECLGSMGGVIVIRPDQWWEAGGSPEMDGWGFEDVMFAVQARTLLRENTWHPGWITHLWHSSECRIGSPSYVQNIEVCRTVEGLDGDATGIRRFIQGSRLYP